MTSLAPWILGLLLAAAGAAAHGERAIVWPAELVDGDRNLQIDEIDITLSCAETPPHG